MPEDLPIDITQLAAKADRVPGRGYVANYHKKDAQIRREDAAVRSAEKQQAQADNGEKDPAATGPAMPFSFHKGLPHDKFGRPDLPSYHRFVSRLGRGTMTYMSPSFAAFDVPLGPRDATHAYRPSDVTVAGEVLSETVAVQIEGTPFVSRLKDGGAPAVRHWESPLAGYVHDLEGPDATCTAIPPAPQGGSDELIAEMAEVYAMAILRDCPFQAFDTTPLAQDVAAALAPLQTMRGREALPTDAAHLFRGSTEGAQTGPYISQFLLAGNGTLSGGDTPADGYVRYGAQRIDQRVAKARPGLDYMTDWSQWLEVQNGADVRGQEVYEGTRFITTPRDLATFVHVDQLYQAYLNACLWLLAEGHPLDVGLPGGGKHPTRDAFATYGGPHLLALLTEVSSRALKAVRYQKFQVHLRGRPEQLAAMLTLAAGDHADALGDGDARQRVEATLDGIPDPILEKIDGIAGAQAQLRADEEIFPRNDAGTPDHPIVTAGQNYLLPMAFAEGSPMHAAYGAGHATVAGACVTILKAFFEMSTTPADGRDRLDPSFPLDDLTDQAFWTPREMGQAFVPNADGTALDPVADTLTVEGELDKLAANISIGRNMGGVHFYSDYYDSLRLGERVAVAILEEQMFTYPERVRMRLTTFDGDRMIVSTEGKGDACVLVAPQGTPQGAGDYSTAAYDDWFYRYAPRA